MVVQIGSNDGRTTDPIYRILKKRKKWKALLVEPVPHIFNRLKKNYSGNDRFSFEQAVINEGVKTQFYWVSEKAKIDVPGLPPWHDQLGGFNRQHILTHMPNLEPYIVSEEINGITLETLLTKHHVSHINLLHIDTEGSDFKILSQINLSCMPPDVILYECKHLSSSDQQKSYELLSAKYSLYNFTDDILAVRKDSERVAPFDIKTMDFLKISL
jgi:FkbM family methyltransferase